MNRGSIVISIPEPCSLNWDEMTLDAEGRYCGSCRKTVIDFTKFTDAELYLFFSRAKEIPCGRFYTTQLNRPIAIPHQPNSRLYRLAIACGLTLLFVPHPSVTRAQTKAQLTETTNVVRKDDTKWALSPIGKVSGRVTGVQNQPIANLLVSAMQTGKTLATTSTQSDGTYEIFPLACGTYDIVIVENAQEVSRATNVFVGNDTASVSNFIVGNFLLTLPVVTTGTAMTLYNDFTEIKLHSYFYTEPHKKKKHKTAHRKHR